MANRSAERRHTGLTDLGGIGYEQESRSFAVHSLDPSRPRRVTITHAGRQLVGSLFLKGDETGPITVGLQPWGTILGRIVDEDGQPRGGLQLSNIGGMHPERPVEQGILPRSTTGPGIRTGRDGWFRVEGLVPGLIYGASASKGFVGIGHLFRDVTVAPGEVKDLAIEGHPAQAGPRAVKSYRQEIEASSENSVPIQRVTLSTAHSK